MQRADVALLGARIPIGHVGRAFDMARQDVADAAVLAQRGIERVDGGARNPEGHGDPFALQNQDGSVHGFHFCHRHLPNASDRDEEDDSIRPRPARNPAWRKER